MNRQIAAAAESQDASTDRVNASMTSITGLWRKTSESASRIASTGTQVSALSRKLQQLLSRFRV